MTEDQIKHMVDRFLNWRLPEPFRPHNGISFVSFVDDAGIRQFQRKPTGANLFGATQTDTMVRHMLEGMPQPEQAAEADRRSALLAGYGDLLAETARLRGLLGACAVQFRYYETQHLRKVPPDTEKARINAGFAEMCEDAYGIEFALASTDVEGSALND